MNTIRVLNLNIRLNSHNEPISYLIRYAEPVVSCDNYFDMLSSSCEAHNIEYTKLLELIIELADLTLFEEEEELPINSNYEDDAYDRYKDDKLLGLI